jgi:hypothetical protein
VSKNSGGEYGHIQDALTRSKRNWSVGDDPEELNRDMKKLLTFYIPEKIKQLGKKRSRLKLWGFSKPAPNEKNEEAQEEALNPIVDYILMPYSLRKTFFIKNEETEKIGTIDINTIEGQLVKALFETSDKNHRIPLTVGGRRHKTLTDRLKNIKEGSDEKAI